MIDLILGTSMWAWTISKSTAFQILDYFYQSGFRQIDTATNYPISQQPQHWRASENILAEWIRAHGISDLKIISKVGSLSNRFSPEHNLQSSFLQLNLDYYQNLFGRNLDTFAIHWDNRNNKAEIEATFSALRVAVQNGLRLGFSGVKHPEIYTELNKDFQFDFRIQIKHHLLQSDYEKYADFHGSNRFITYGINAGGLKLQTQRYHSHSYLKMRGGDTAQTHPMIEKLKPILNQINAKKDRLSIEHFYQIGLTYAFYSPDIQGILLGSSNVEQWRGNVAFFEKLKKNEFEDLYEQLAKSDASKFNKI